MGFFDKLADMFKGGSTVTLQEAKDNPQDFFGDKLGIAPDSPIAQDILTAYGNANPNITFEVSTKQNGNMEITVENRTIGRESEPRVIGVIEISRNGEDSQIVRFDKIGGNSHMEISLDGDIGQNARNNIGVMWDSEGNIEMQRTLEVDNNFEIIYQDTYQEGRCVEKVITVSNTQTNDVETYKTRYNEEGERIYDSENFRTSKGESLIERTFDGSRTTSERRVELSGITRRIEKDPETDRTVIVERREKIEHIVNAETDIKIENKLSRITDTSGTVIRMEKHSSTTDARNPDNSRRTVEIRTEGYRETREYSLDGTELSTTIRREDFELTTHTEYDSSDKSFVTRYFNGEDADINGTPYEIVRGDVDGRVISRDEMQGDTMVHTDYSYDTADGKCNERTTYEDGRIYEIHEFDDFRYSIDSQSNDNASAKFSDGERCTLTDRYVTQDGDRVEVYQWENGLNSEKIEITHTDNGVEVHREKETYSDHTNEYREEYKEHSTMSEDTRYGENGEPRERITETIRSFDTPKGISSETRIEKVNYNRDGSVEKREIDYKVESRFDNIELREIKLETYKDGKLETVTELHVDYNATESDIETADRTITTYDADGLVESIDTVSYNEETNEWHHHVENADGTTEEFTTDANGEVVELAEDDPDGEFVGSDAADGEFVDTDNPESPEGSDNSDGEFIDSDNPDGEFIDSDNTDSE